MFVRAGAKLSEPDKARLRAMNEEISSLMTQFKQNVLKASKEGAVVVQDVKDLDGLSPEQIGASTLAHSELRIAPSESAMQSSRLQATRNISPNWL